MLMSDEFRQTKWYSIVIGHDGDVGFHHQWMDDVLEDLSLNAATWGGYKGQEWIAEAWGHGREQGCLVIDMLKGEPGRPQPMSLAEIKEVMGPLVKEVRKKASSTDVRIIYAYLIRREEAYVKVQSL